MKENIKKLYNDILERKFSKNMSAGYEPLEVDIFLDSVRSALVGIDKEQRSLYQDLNQKNQEILDLKKIINQKDSIIESLRADNESLKKDGYQSQKLMNDLGKLHVAVSELQNEKNNK